ncbi:MAG: hypothetical protein ACTS4X_01785 [Candidatus Hodgkinia cicadicola]
MAVYLSALIRGWRKPLRVSPSTAMDVDREGLRRKFVWSELPLRTMTLFGRRERWSLANERCPSLLRWERWLSANVSAV